MKNHQFRTIPSFFYNICEGFLKHDKIRWATINICSSQQRSQIALVYAPNFRQLALR